MANYLDSDGLLYFWQKIKSMLAAKVDTVSGKGLSANDFTAAYKSKLDGIAAGANAYSLPTATASVLGGVKSGSNITNTSGVLSLTKANVTAALGYTPPTTNTTYGVVTASANGLMIAADKSKLDGFSAASNYALKSDITNMYKYKGSVAATANLPTSGNVTGDVYNVEASGMNYAWNGTAWDALGAIFSITSITNAAIDTILAS